MATRLDLHAKLVEILGSPYVYFQPPENLSMVYPCIVYQRDRQNSRYADNVPYKVKQRYQLTVIDQNPDSEIPSRVAALPLCSYERYFAAANLNHDVFNLFF